MGRARLFRQKLISHVDSVGVKTVYSWVLQQTRDRFGAAQDEAEQIAQKAFLLVSRTLVKRSEEQILFHAIQGRDKHQKRESGNLPRQEVVLTPWSHDDLEVHREFGLKALQNARLLRLIEEAYRQGVSLSASMLVRLTNITAKSLRERLIPLWELGLRLPVAGMARKYRQAEVFRSTWALERFFAGERLDTLRERLCLSLATWRQYELDFLRVVQLTEAGLDAAAISAKLALDLQQVIEYQTLQQRTGGAALLSEMPSGRLAYATASSPAGTDPQTVFLTELQAHHGFSPAKAHSYLGMLRDLAAENLGQQRKAETVVYYAVADHEPPGKMLSECEFVPVQLDYYAEADQEVAGLDTTSELKWRRLLRYTTQAKAQGALLTQPDLAFLLGVHAGVIQRLMQEHDKVFLPTRGNMADMGPGLSHAAKIVELYLQGYTETEIVRRTSHTYASVENYLLTFAKVVGLMDRGMPLPLIRKTIGCSMKLVEKHAALYERYNTPDYQFTLMQLRRALDNYPAKKGN